MLESNLHGIVSRSLEQLAEVFVLRLLMITLLAPQCHSLAVENENVEKRVHQQYAVRCDAATVHVGLESMDDARGIDRCGSNLLESKSTGVGGPLKE